jgi:hypothetical protein
MKHPNLGGWLSGNMDIFLQKKVGTFYGVPRLDELEMKEFFRLIQVAFWVLIGVRPGGCRGLAGTF